MNYKPIYDWMHYLMKTMYAILKYAWNGNGADVFCVRPSPYIVCFHRRIHIIIIPVHRLICLLNSNTIELNTEKCEYIEDQSESSRFNPYYQIFFSRPYNSPISPNERAAKCKWQGLKYAWPDGAQWSMYAPWCPTWCVGKYANVNVRVMFQHATKNRLFQWKLRIQELVSSSVISIIIYDIRSNYLHIWPWNAFELHIEWFQLNSIANGEKWYAAINVQLVWLAKTILPHSNDNNMYLLCWIFSQTVWQTKFGIRFQRTKHCSVYTVHIENYIWGKMKVSYIKVDGWNFDFHGNVVLKYMLQHANCSRFQNVAMLDLSHLPKNTFISIERFRYL